VNHACRFTSAYWSDMLWQNRTSHMSRLREFFGKLDWKLIVFPVVFLLSGYASYLVLTLYIYPASHPYFILVLVLASFGVALILTSVIFVIFIICLLTLFAPLNSYRFNKYLKTVKQDGSARVAIILGYPNWFHFNGWYKINFTKYEIELLFKYLDKQGKTFRIYPRAGFEDVEKIMADANVREVFFCGHGDSHVFKLSTDKTLFYCDFKDPRYKKDFVHQVHCGTMDGKDRRLIDYVVPVENRGECFYFPKLITSRTIRKEFKRRIEVLSDTAERTSSG